MISADIAALAYLAAGVLFIMALRGLSSPASARQGNNYGMVGMGLAILTTLAVAGPSDLLSWALIIGGLGIGGVIGAVMARRVKMTDMPQLVAAFHSLVGLAAVFVAAAALYAPESFGIGTHGHIHAQSLIEMSLGAAIGAFTFTGSVIAFAKLNGNMSGTPILLPNRHLIHIALGALLVVLMVLFFVSADPYLVLGHHAAGAGAWRADDHPDRRAPTCRWWFPCSTPIRAGRRQASASPWAIAR